jgi:hypothetical protein
MVPPAGAISQDFLNEGTEGSVPQADPLPLLGNDALTSRLGQGA